MDAGTCTCSSVALTYVVLTLEPLICTCDVLMNPEPVIVTEVGWDRSAWIALGETDEMAGVGMTGVDGLELPAHPIRDTRSKQGNPK